MTGSDDIDWNRPINAGRVVLDPRDLEPIYGGPGDDAEPPVVAGRRSYVDHRFARNEQLRRLTMLLKAAGAKPATPRNQADLVAAFAAILPGMRYSARMLVYQTLAPEPPDFALWGPSKARGPGGRPPKWTDRQRRWFAQQVEKVRSEAVTSTGRALTRAQALRRVRKMAVDQTVEMLLESGWPKDDAAQEAERRVPDVGRIKNICSEVKQADQAGEKAVT